MNKNHIGYRASTQRMSPQFLSSKNSLGITQTESLWDKTRQQIVYIIKTKQTVNREVDVMVRDNLMTLEVPLDSSYDKPLRTHKVGKENRNEIEEGFNNIGFSEFRLKPGYQYTLFSSQVINPNLIKVVLGFKPEGVFRNN